jgi:hypothetical protein
LVVLTNSSLPPKAPDCAINRNWSISALYTILYIMYARAIQPVTGLDLHLRPGMGEDRGCAPSSRRARRSSAPHWIGSSPVPSDK